MQKDLKFIIKIIKQAGRLVTADFVVNQKGEGSDLVTNIDLEIENFLINKIKACYPGFDIVSEENNPHNNVSQNCFIIDPIDGTINFANNVDMWGIQIACVRNYETTAAAIYLAARGELYYADKNGAYLNGKRILVSKYKAIKNALYAVDGTNNLPYLEKMRPHSSNRRCFGSCAVSYAFVARGWLHGASFGSDKPWDYAPGLFIVEMAGGKTLDKKGGHMAACNMEFLDILEKETSREV